MIYTLTDFICLNISILLIFLMFCLSDFIDNCKSPVDTFSETNSFVYNNKVSSQYSLDRNSPSFRTHAWGDLCWSVGRHQSQNWIRRLVLSFGIVFYLGWNSGFWDFPLLSPKIPPLHTSQSMRRCRRKLWVIFNPMSCWEKAQV